MRGANWSMVEPGLDAGAHIFDAVGERVGELEVERRPGLLHVIAGNRNRVELRHVRGGVREDVGDDAQARLRRIDVGVAHHEFFEDVVLDRAGQLLLRHALFLGGDDVERQHRQHRAVHGHRHAHLIERDAGEQRAHVVDRVDRDARHADVAGDARMIAVVAAVGGEIEGDREALLAGGEVAPVEGVGIFGGREAGILPDRPGLRGVHRGVGAAQERRRTGPGVEEVEAGDVGFAVVRLDRDAFRRLPGFFARRRWRGGRFGEGNGGEVRNLTHVAPRLSCVVRRVASTSQPMKIKVFTPASLSAASNAPGRPARCTVAPAAVERLARHRPLRSHRVCPTSTGRRAWRLRL